MIISPEFRRNLWLELTPHRLIAMPVILVAIFILSALIEETSRSSGLRVASISAFYIIVYLWGTRRAAAALADEVRGRTWDSQRMSALDAWSMTWGKLLGGTAFIWYGGVICLLAFVAAESNHTSAATAWRLAATAMFSGLFGQVVAFVVALVLLRKMPSRPRLPVTLCQFFGLCAVVPFGFDWPLIFRRFPESAEGILWYGWTVPAADFRLLSVSAFLIWAIIAAYRLMRVELQHRALPWVWICFSLFLMTYAAGFVWETGSDRFHYDEGPAMWLLTPSFLVAVSLLYAALFAEPKDTVSQRALVRATAAADWPRVGYLLPLWLPSLFLLLVLGVLLMTQVPIEPLSSDGLLQLGPKIAFSAFVVLAIMLFVLRDIGIVMLLSLRSRRKRPDLVAFVYLLLLYTVFGGLVGSAGWDSVLPFFLPVPGDTALWTVGPVFAEVLLVCVALGWRWHQGGALITPASSELPS
ncbi:MAG: hypothetical protein V3T80_01650 [Kiloniellales bacterium]